MINLQNIEQAKKAIKHESTPKIVKAQDEEFNRKILEYGKFDIIFGLEESFEKNRIRQTNSGFNHVLGKIATKNNIAIGFNLEGLKKIELKQKAETLSKIKQNIAVSRKCKNKIAIKTNSIKEAQDFIIGLGGSSKQASEAIVF